MGRKKTMMKNSMLTIIYMKVSGKIGIPFNCRTWSVNDAYL